MTQFNNKALLEDLSLEAQAATVLYVRLNLRLSASERKHLEKAEQTLRTLAALRQKCLDGPDSDEESDFSEHLSCEIIKLLELPIGA